MSFNGGRQRRLRADQNEQAVQAHNQRRAALEEAGGADDDALVPFACECDDPSCVQAIELTVPAYERAVAAPDQFVVVPGHQDTSVEVVVEEHESYLVVAKPDLED